jgi:hypothetical protein
MDREELYHEDYKVSKGLKNFDFNGFLKYPGLTKEEIEQEESNRELEKILEDRDYDIDAENYYAERVDEEMTELLSGMRKN